jgi:pimeloyl-ACP methyl ester carboxylesterase
MSPFPGHHKLSLLRAHKRDVGRIQKGDVVMTGVAVTNTGWANLGDVEVQYSVHGAGEPVLFIHGAIVPDTFQSLIQELSVSERYQAITYHRRGYTGSIQPDGPVSIERQAADAIGLLQHLGIERAHIVGHSYGGTIALQLALDAPQAVHSLALLEPALPMVPGMSDFMDQMVPVSQMFQAGDRSSAIDAFCQAVAGPEYRLVADRELPPGWVEQAAVDADTFFAIEIPALMEWTFTPELAAGITAPILSVLGTRSADIDPTTREAHELLQSWLPQTEEFLLPDATHLLQMMDPGGMARGLSRFWTDHAAA